MRILTKDEMKAVSGGIIARIPFPGERGLRNATSPLNASRKPKGWAGDIVVLPPDTK